MNTLDTREGDDMQSEMEKKGMLFRAESAKESINTDQALHERIAQKAYEFYQKRGKSSGHDLEDWLEAEREVLGREELADREVFSGSQA